MSDSIVVARPEGPVGQLVLLFHSAGTGVEDMVPLGRALADEFPTAFVVSVAAPAQPGGGREWFSMLEIDESNRAARVAAAMPGFVDTVRQWQREAGVGTLVKLDVRERPDLARKYGIAVVPTVLAVAADGEVLERLAP